MEFAKNTEMDRPSEKNSLEFVHNGSMEKIKRYNWKIDNQQGTFMMVNKASLCVPEEYQRDLIQQKTRDMASDWSWFGCGVLTIANRGGVFWIVDGQHRWRAAMMRADIQNLPCLVFQSESLETEADAFLKVNSGRKPVTSLGKQRALVVSGDHNAVFVQNLLNELCLLSSKSAKSSGQIKCLALCTRLAGQNKERFERSLRITAQIAKKDDLPIYERVLDSLFYIDANCESSLLDKRLIDKLVLLGTRGIVDAANRASSFYARGGSKIWAIGVLEAVNKGLRNRFEMKNSV